VTTTLYPCSAVVFCGVCCTDLITSDSSGWTVLATDSQSNVGTWSVLSTPSCGSGDVTEIDGSATWNVPSGPFTTQFSGSSGYQFTAPCGGSDSLTGVPDSEFGASTYTLTITSLTIGAVGGGDSTPSGPLIERYCLTTGEAYRFTYTFNSDFSIDVVIDQLQIPV
jgi:hypothetical protein